MEIVLRPHSTQVGGLPQYRGEILVVWKARDALMPDATYEVEIAGDAVWTDQPTFEVTTTGAPFAGLDEAPSFASLSATREDVSARLTVMCPGDGECPSCRYADLEELTAVEAQLPSSAIDPYVLHRLVPDTGAPITRDAIMWLSEDDGFVSGVNDTRVGHLYFESDASEYCFHLESESLIDGSIVEGPSTCIPAPEVVVPPEPDSSGAGCATVRGRASPLSGLITALLIVVLLRQRR
jgi:hypothetical protein